MAHSFALAAALAVALSTSPKQVCKSASGKFAKCGSPGAVAVKPRA